MKKILLFFFLITSNKAVSFTANWVKYEFHPHFYRIIVEYTILELKEKREAIIELTNKKKADKIYGSLLRGGEFFIQGKEVIFIQNQKKPSPW